ncbi:hypothetical protein Patl1_07959 [Pistacia atlantica]|uniref:Uncharacterized protein n=1 Tax=Pistacia atlantica TaxID=434234 RepID=A0ACC1AJF5_9ROSI|nr:hypothetical protein Patl1_07959 [Pistacia atlantica]
MSVIICLCRVLTKVMGFQFSMEKMLMTITRGTSMIHIPMNQHLKTLILQKDMVHDDHRYCKEDPNTLKTLIDYCEKPLYNRCKYSTFSGFMKFQYLKEKYGWLIHKFLGFVVYLHDVLPNENSMPKSMYDTKKFMAALGLEYKKIHAYQNDCIIFRNEYKDLSKCPSCGASHWKKQVGKSSSNSKVPSKVLCYFLPILRFRRMFQSSQTTYDLTWHGHNNKNDGKLQHPVDSPTWKLIDSESRNLRMALSTDGFNPHRSLSCQYSCWLMMLVTCNLPTLVVHEKEVHNVDVIDLGSITTWEQY